jgi:voltage-gated potassium channel
MSRVEAWERRTDVPMAVLALAFLIAYGWPIVAPDTDPDLLRVLDVVRWGVWAVFLVEYVVRLSLATDRGHYARTHWYGVLFVLLPPLQPLVMIRALARIRIDGERLLGRRRNRITGYVAGVTLVAIVLGSLAVLDAERDAPGANITTFGDSVWWTFVTVCTVGYGDLFPVTGQGRAIAVVLMLVGIALVGAVTANAAAWFMERVHPVGEQRPTDDQPRQH